MLAGILALVGLGITLAGGIISAVGQNQKNKADIAEAEAKQKVYDAQQAALEKQIEYIANQKKTATDLAAINEKQIQQMADISVKQGEVQKQGLEVQKRGMVVQGISTSEAGSQAKGSAVASAGTGNLGGASVLRKAQAIQTQTSRQIGIINANIGQANTQIGLVGEQQQLTKTMAVQDIAKQELNLKSTLEGLDVSALESQENLVSSQTNEEINQSNIQFLKDYGWMSVAATALGAGSNLTNQAVSTDWNFGKSASLATESYDWGEQYREGMYGGMYGGGWG